MYMILQQGSSFICSLLEGGVSLAAAHTATATVCPYWQGIAYTLQVSAICQKKRAAEHLLGHERSAAAASCQCMYKLD